MFKEKRFGKTYNLVENGTGIIKGFPFPTYPVDYLPNIVPFHVLRLEENELDKG